MYSPVSFFVGATSVVQEEQEEKFEEPRVLRQFSPVLGSDVYKLGKDKVWVSYTGKGAYGFRNILSKGTSDPVFTVTPPGTAVVSAKVQPLGLRLLAYATRNRVVLHDLTTKFSTESATLSVPAVGVTNLEWSPAGRFLAILTHDGTIRVYDSVLATIKTVASFSLFSWLKPLLGPCGRCRRSGTSGSATAAGRHVLAWNPNGEFLASFKGNDIHLWETWTWKRSRLLADGEVKALAWNSSGDTLYAVILLDHKPVLSIFKDPLALAPPPAHERTKPVPRDISVRSLGRWEAAREYRALMETEETLSSAVVVDFELVRSVPLLKECRGLKVNHPIIAVASELVAVGVPSDADTTMTLAVVDTVTNQTRLPVVVHTAGRVVDMQVVTDDSQRPLAALHMQAETQALWEFIPL